MACPLRTQHCDPKFRNCLHAHLLGHGFLMWSETGAWFGEVDSTSWALVWTAGNGVETSTFLILGS